VFSGVDCNSVHFAVPILAIQCLYVSHTNLEILTGLGIGLAVWNFRGSFGIMDSGWRDVEYEDFHGHKLDRKYLDLLQEFD
jgi:hypothetical protein